MVVPERAEAARLLNLRRLRDMRERLEPKATSDIDSDCASTRFDSLSISNASASGADDDVVWSPVTFVTRSPGSRVFPSAVVHRSSLYIFGGHDGHIYRNDLLIFNLETHGWQLDIELSGGPSPRDAHAAVVHADCMYVFGGYDSKRYLNDFHRFHFDSAVWSTVAYGGGAPSPRGGHTAIVNNNEMLVFGGCDGWHYFNDLFRYRFDSEQWTPVRVTGTMPGARSAPATVIHEEQQHMFVFGGYDGNRSLNDLFRFSLKTSEWAQVRCTGTPPSPRGGHTAVVHGNTMYAFGGKSGRSPFNDLHSFDFENSSWTELRSGSSAPAPRCAHTCVVHGTSLFIFGGYDGRRYFDDCFELAVQKPEEEAVLSLSGDLQPMVNNPQFSDVTFVVEGRSLHAHKFILFARSEYFRRMFTSGYRESTDSMIHIHDVRYDVFLCVLSFLYTGKPREDIEELAEEVLGASNLYSIDPLKRICVDLMKRSICIENVASILRAADTYQVTLLRQQCIQFMVEHFGEVVRSEGFQVRRADCPRSAP